MNARRYLREISEEAIASLHMAELGGDVQLAFDTVVDTEEMAKALAILEKLGDDIAAELDYQRNRED